MAASTGRATYWIACRVKDQNEHSQRPLYSQRCQVDGYVRSESSFFDITVVLHGTVDFT